MPRSTTAMRWGPMSPAVFRQHAEPIFQGAALPRGYVVRRSADRRQCQPSYSRSSDNRPKIHRCFALILW